MRAVLKLVWLTAILLAHVPLVLWSRLRGGGARLAHRSGRGVLVVTPFAPGEDSGGAKAAQDFIALLTRYGKVEVISAASLTPRAKWRMRLGAMLSWPLPLPPQCRTVILGHPGLDARGTPDVVVFEFFATALYLYLRRIRARRVIVRDHEVLVRKIDMEYKGSRGLAAWAQAFRLATCYLVSLAVYSRVDRIITLTAEDREAVVSWFPSLADRVTAIPPIFEPAMAPLPAPPSDAPVRDLLLVANFFHRPNVDGLLWFLRECAPHLEPGFTLHLCGRDGPLDGVDLTPHGLRLRRHGFVPNISAVVPRGAIAVAPVVSGGGVRIKNLLLASLGTAVVTTPLGNEGIGFTDGYDAVVVSNGRDMASRINGLAHLPEEITRFGARARSLVQDRFGPNAIFEQVRTELGC